MASRLAARIQDEFGITAELIRGDGGIYEVTVNKAVVFSYRCPRHQIPGDDTLLEEIRKHLNQL